MRSFLPKAMHTALDVVEWVLCWALDAIESGGMKWLVDAVFIALVALAWVLELSGALGCVGNWQGCM